MPDTTGFDLYLSDISPDDKPWDKNRRHASKIEGLYQLGDFHRYADRMKQCSRQLLFALKANDEGEFKLRLHAAKFCRCRYCSICQWRKSLMWKARFLQALPRILEAHSTDRWVFLTLTVRNCPLSELRSTVAHMNKSWERLSKRKSFPARGWLKSVEVTRAEDGYAHPHFHVLMQVPASYFSHGYVTQAEWTELWRKSLRVEYSPVVHVTAVQNRRRREIDPSKVGLPSEIVAGLLETLKYTVKPDDLFMDLDSAVNAAWLQGLTEQLHKTRSVALGGVFKQYISEDEPDDLINAEGDEIEELKGTDITILFGWRENYQRYVKIERE
jgi:plasmid rolling circle replication initiator protein Rep